jgi:tetratricopeptide (TPR) repeat protein
MMDEVFVGRRDEQARFGALLRDLAADGARRGGGWRRFRRSGEDVAGASISRVVLVHGLGGSGKSRLLGCFRDMAEGRAANSPVRHGQVLTVWLDWEDEQRDEPGTYAAAEGPGLVTVLDAVQAAVVDALGTNTRAKERAERAFSDYRRGAARMPEYAARFADVLAQSRQPGSTFTSQDAAVLLKAAASAGLLVGGHPGGLLGLSPDQLAATAQAGGHLSAAAARAVTGKNTDELTADEYRLVTDPARELPRRAAAALRAVADGSPLLVFLDTGEVIGDRAWGWLRRVMAETGPTVAWVVGARFETEAEAGADSPVARFVHDIGDEYLMLMSPTRFDDAMIRAYLEGRLGGRDLGDDQIDMIARFTRGLPLAVSLTATLLGQGQRVEEVCREADHGHPGTVVSHLARRYLVHAERQEYPAGDPRRDDVMRILGLALAFGDVRGDPDLLAALWDTDDPLTAFADLARRHDFVLPVSRRLHDDVRDTLRADLLDPYRRARARQVNQRAIALFTNRLSQMRDRWPTLDEQLDHTSYTTALLAALWHTLWADNQAGLDLLTQILPVLAIADSPTAATAAAMTEQFEPTFHDDQSRDLDRLTESGPVRLLDDLLIKRQATFVSTARRVKFTLSGLAFQPCVGPAPAALLIGTPGDRDVAVMVLRAGIQSEDGDDRSAIATLRATVAQATSTRMRQAIGVRADAIAQRLVWAGPGGTSVPTAIGLEAAELATTTLPGHSVAWQTYGAALHRAGRNEEALTAHDQSLVLNPEASTHNSRGNALRRLGRYEDALAAYDQALVLYPAYAFACNGRGVVLRVLGRYEDALAAYDRALALDPNYAAPCNGRGNVLRVLGRYEGALAAYDRALASDPNYASAHENKGIVLAVIGDSGQALSEFDTAGRLDPDGAGEGRVWAAAVLWHQGEPALSRDHFALVQGRVTWCTPFVTAAVEAIALCGLGQVDTAKQHLLDAMSLRAPGDQADLSGIFDLLSEPPLPGIERLRAIVERPMEPRNRSGA